MYFELQEALREGAFLMAYIGFITSNVIGEHVPFCRHPLLPATGVNILFNC